MSTPINPKPVQEYKPDFLPAYVSNGWVGMRVGQFALLNGTAVVNGFVGVHEVDKVEGYAYVPYPAAGDIRIGPWWLSQHPEWAVFQEQSYDFSTGELHTKFLFKVDDVICHVEVTTFCSRSLPTLVLQEIKVKVDSPCDLSLKALIQPRGVPGRCIVRNTTGFGGPNVVDGCMLWESPGSLSRLGIAYATEFSGSTTFQKRLDHSGYMNGLSTEYRFEAQRGISCSIRQITSLIPSIVHAEPELQAVRMASIGEQKGYDEIREENKKAWEEIWKGRLRILGGGERWQQMADAAYFYLHTSIHPSSPCSTGLFGLGQWHNYHYFRGHVFWDIETFAFPVLLLTAPCSARAVLDYRIARLPAAKANAAMNGYRGIQFPWESAPSWGYEVTPVWASHVYWEHHITLDVAFAFAQYVHATGDEIFLKEKAWPVLYGSAEWVASRVVKTKRGYEILEVTGIDEGAYKVDNNAYTNMAAVVVLKEAVDFARRLGYKPPWKWIDVAEKMYIPIHPDIGVVLKYDGYEYKGEICCPDPLAGFFPYGYEIDSQIQIKTIEFYLDKAQSYVGYPMMSSLLGVYAARLGERQLSADLFEKGVADFFFEPFSLIDEFGKVFTSTKPKVGPYLANLGGFLMACMYGLTGLQLDAGEPETWLKGSIVMPKGWDGIELEQIWVHDKPARLVAQHGDERARMKFL